MTTEEDNENVSICLIPHHLALDEAIQRQDGDADGIVPHVDVVTLCKITVLTKLALSLNRYSRAQVGQRFSGLPTKFSIQSFNKTVVTQQLNTICNV